MGVVAAIAAVGTVAAAGASIYSATKKQPGGGTGVSPGVAQPGEFKPRKLSDTTLLDLGKIDANLLQSNISNFPQSAELSQRTNRFNINEALKAYTSFQPMFSQLQSQVGQNALSFARGELPADVVSSIGRSAAERGIQGGFAGGGVNGAFGGGNSALKNLNLRNLGLTSLDLSKMGTSLAMQADAQAKALSPILSSPTDFMPTMNQALSVAQFNANTLNDNQKYNNELTNSADLGNLSANNQYNQALMNSQYAGRLNQMQSMIEGAGAIGSAALDIKNAYGNRSSTASVPNAGAWSSGVKAGTVTPSIPSSNFA